MLLAAAPCGQTDVGIGQRRGAVAAGGQQPEGGHPATWYLGVVSGVTSVRLVLIKASVRSRECVFGGGVCVILRSLFGLVPQTAVGAGEM